VPIQTADSKKGIAATLTKFSDLKNHPDVLVSGDFSGKTWPDSGFVNGVTKYSNTASSTTYACSQLVKGKNLSLNIRADASNGK
jgi:hypothetical protein